MIRQVRERVDEGWIRSRVAGGKEEMRNMRKISKPCPGCGATGCYRKADEVCNDCRHVLDSWKKYQAEFSQKKELATVVLKGAWHWYPQFYACGPRSHPKGFSETRQTLGELFSEL